MLNDEQKAFICWEYEWEWHIEECLLQDWEVICEEVIEDRWDYSIMMNTIELERDWVTRTFEIFWYHDGNEDLPSLEDDATEVHYED